MNTIPNRSNPTVSPDYAPGRSPTVGRIRLKNLRCVGLTKLQEVTTELASSGVSFSVRNAPSRPGSGYTSAFVVNPRGAIPNMMASRILAIID